MTIRFYIVALLHLDKPCLNLEFLNVQMSVALARLCTNASGREADICFHQAVTFTRQVFFVPWVFWIFNAISVIILLRKMRHALRTRIQRPCSKEKRRGNGQASNPCLSILTIHLYLLFEQI